MIYEIRQTASFFRIIFARKMIFYSFLVIINLGIFYMVFCD